MAEVLYRPPDDVLETTRLGDYLGYVNRTYGLDLRDYAALWDWSVTDLEAFWRSIWDYSGVIAHAQPEAVLTTREMPGAVWFPGAKLNYAEHALRDAGDTPAVIARSQTRPADVMLSRGEVADQVARAAAGLRRLGVGPGDRVAAYLPNIPEALIAFLATASLGAIWSSCAPEFGTRSVTDRFAQITPKVLLTIDGYRYGSKDVDRSAEVAAIRSELPSLEATVALGYLEPDGDSIPGAIGWDELLGDDAELTFEPVAFDHPLYILYSSGTTGLPKPIVHGHGGILLEHFKVLALHHDLGPGDHFFWFSTTGWMMWNYLMSALLVDAAAVMFDGNPGHPDLDVLWQLAADTNMTFFGTSAPFIHACMRAGLRPGEAFDLSALRGVGSTGSPLSPEGFDWVYDAVSSDLLLASASGGTDVCTAFVAAAPLVEVRAGEIPCRCLGAKVEAFDPDGKSVIGELGELVITEPMPSMPVRFWGDDDGSRYRDAYFADFPGVWRHGDWIKITDRGSCVITGRSDATLNRGGVRMGTAEFYRVVEAIDGVADSLVVHLTDADRLLLFVAMDGGLALDDDLRARIASGLREHLSPRHVPDEVHEVDAVPRTLSGKKLEVPVQRILTGQPADKVANRGAMANPSSLDAFVEFASRKDSHHA